MRITYITLFALFISCSPTKSTEESAFTIAFGSCSKQTKTDAQLWKEVIAENPDLWIWLGDNIYADTEDMEKMKSDYDLQKSHPDYQQLLTNTEVIGVWDDHDFGSNDAGKEYPQKDASRDLLFDFLDVDKTNEAWGRKGAYQSYVYMIDNKKTKIILLDGRYFRDSLNWSSDPKSAIINPEGTILGETQWQWFEKELDDSSVDFFIVGCGIQVLTEDHRFEKWANFPKERARMLDLVAQKVTVPLVFISGDRHISEVSKIDLNGYEYPLYDFTSSSLTSPWNEESHAPNEIRIGEIIYPVNFAVMNIDVSNENFAINFKYVGKNNEVLQESGIKY